jgi:hypothetical protein
VLCFCDADEKKQGTSHFNIPVRSIIDVKKRFEKGEYTIVICIREPKTTEVKKELLALGFTEYDIYDNSTDVLNLCHFTRPTASTEAYYTSFMEVSKNFIELCDMKSELLDDLLSDITIQYRALHKFERLRQYRHRFIPWLNSLKGLKQASILEIGCETGVATVTFAEQGANVTAIDINEKNLEIAKERMKIYGLQVDFQICNAMDIDNLNKEFDFIIFSASLEHMTFNERISSIQKSYSIINDNQ